ncbi:MAG: WD40 repeat domain-containing protein [Pseudonocardiaceae bacterium]
MTTATEPPTPAQDAPDRTVPECPYVGLMPFDEEDAAYFFGRQRESDLIVANLTASRLTLLYAPSGVGKSSVLRAGVLPALHHIDDDSYDDLGVPGAAVAYASAWRDAPLATVAAAVSAAVSRVTGAGAVEEAASAPELSVAWLREVLRQSRVSTVYLILDQFEEYFLYHSTDRGEEGLTAELGRILSARDLPVHVLLSIREDALAGLDRFKGRVPYLFDNYLRLAHLSRDAAHAAIEGPLDRYNRLAPPDRAMSIEPGLIATLLDQVRTGQVRVAPEGAAPDGFTADEAAADDRGDIETPYLQLVLTRLWDQERAIGSSCLRQRSLDDLGGAQTIVQTHLDNVMAGLSPTQVNVAAAVFHHLVTASGTKIALTAEDLAGLLELPVSAVRDLLEMLCSGPHRILRPLPPAVGVAGPPRYEIFHDVMGAAVLDWRRRHVTQQHQAEASRRLVAEREEARTAARAARQRLRRTQLVAMSMVVMLLATIAFGVLFYVRNRDTRQERFLEQAAATIDHDPVQSLKSAAAAYNINANEQARSAILKAWSSPRSRVVAGPNPMIIGMVLTPDSRHVVAYSADGGIRVIGDDGSVEHKTEVVGPLRGAVIPAVGEAAVDPGASRVALGTDRGMVAVINTTTGRHIDIDTEDASTLAVSWVGSAADGLVLVVSGSGTAATYSPETGKQVARFPGVVAEALPLADGQHIVTSGQDGKLRVWDARTPTEIAESSALEDLPHFLTRDGQAVVSVIENITKPSIVVWNWRAGPDPARYPFAYHDDISQVHIDEQDQTISIAADHGLTRYSLVDGLSRGQLPEQTDAINDVTTSPDDRWITTAGSDGRILIWYANFRSKLADRPTYELLAHRGQVLQVGYMRAGTVVMSLGSDGTIRRWDLPQVPFFDKHKNWIYDMDLSRDGSLLATASSDGKAYIIDSHDPSKVLATVSTKVRLVGVRFDPTDPHRVLILVVHQAAPELWRWGAGNPERVQTYAEPPPSIFGELVSFAVSPNGLLIAGIDSSGTLKLWDTRTGALRTDRHSLGAEPFTNYAVAFDPSSQLIAATGPDGVRVWRLGTAEPLLRLAHPNANGVVFDPSGQRLVSTAPDGTVTIWRTRDGTREQELTLHDAPSSNPSFSRDGYLLAVGTAEGLVEIWDVHSGMTVTLDRHHSDQVSSVVFLPDRSRLVSASDDSTVAFFSCPACSDPDRVIREAVEWAETH